MKKFATLAVLAALATAASAATITWGFGGVVYISEDGATAVRANTYEGSVPWSLALIYVGQNQDSFDLGVMTDDNDANDYTILDTRDYAVSTTGKAAGLGKWSPTEGNSYVTAYDNGASFAVVLYNESTGAFDYVYSGSTSVGSAFTTAYSVTDMSGQGSATIYATGSGSTTGVVNVSVPEPGIACMALIGLGMMIKRRRA